MKTIELDTKQSNRPWFAIADRDRTNMENASTYTSAQRAELQKIFDLLDLAYTGKFYKNFSKKFGTVKIEKPQVRNNATRKEVESILEEKGVTKVVTPQGVTYRMMKK